MAESQGSNSVLHMIVRGLAEQPEIALARIWLVGPGDICPSCPMRSVCPDQTRCLHLAASAGSPLVDSGAGDGVREDWSRIDGHFRRIPLNIPPRLGHIATTCVPLHIRIQGEGEEPLCSSRPDWVKAQKIRDFASQPILHEDEVLGMLAVFSRTELSERESGWVRAFADQAAVFISSVQIAEQAAERDTSVAVSEQWRAVLEKSPIGVALTDVNSRFLVVNRAYEKLLGYTEAELRKLSFFDITPEEFRESNRRLAKELWAGNREQYELEKPYRRKDGSLVWVRLHASTVQGTAKLPRFCMALCEDITERKHAEESLRKSEERLRTLLEINNAIMTNLSQEALLGSIAEVLHRVVRFERAALTLYLPEKKLFRFVAIEGGYHSDYFHPGLEIRPEDSSVGWVFRHQRPVLRRDLEKEQQYPNDRRLAQEGFRSYCAVPLIVRGASIGTLNVGSMAKNQYSEADAEFLQEVAKQVALAVENMKSFEEIATLKARLEKENVYLQEEISSEHDFEEIVGNSPPLLEVLRAVEQVAPTDSTVLIQGETGTGKELIARAIHNLSPRKSQAFVKVNCAAIPLGLLESELFGHEKGAFTGAISQRIGRFELAHKGTLFLDEIGDIPLELQPKLLRVLQEQEFERLGSSRMQRVDVRLVAATNAGLAQMIADKKFRADLYYRLNIFPIDVPPLRDRREDIPPLVRRFVDKYARRMGRTIDTIPNETMEALCRYAWPGNIRELQNLMERAVLLSLGPSLHVPLTEILLSIDQKATPGTNVLEQTEREQILRALRKSNGVIGGPNGAAARLGLKRTSLAYKMQRLGITRSSQ